MKSKKVGAALLLLLICMVTISFSVQLVRAEPKTIRVPTDYPSIQGAINAASPGDTILVASGTYYEHVQVNKAVTLTGENRDTTVIDGGRTGTVVTVTSSNVYISGFTIRNSGSTGYGLEYGLAVLASMWNTIAGNRFLTNSYGIGVRDGSSNNKFSNNIMLNNMGGMYLQNSHYNNVNNNTILNNQVGILSQWSRRNTFIGNIVSNNVLGISLYYGGEGFVKEVGGCTLRNNSMISNAYNFGMEGEYLPSYIHDIDTSNTVNGKPIYYWINKHHSQVPDDAGYVGIVDSTNIILKDLNLTSNIQGVLFAYTDDSIIKNVNASNNKYGIQIVCCNNMTIADNNILSTEVRAIYAAESNNNRIYTNTVIGGWQLLTLSGSNNIVKGNTLSNGLYGISLSYASNNSIYHNNFTNNKYQVYNYESRNTWDDGYPSCGNYWSDYVGVDVKSGPNQDQPGSDGIGDTPYIIDANNKDRYPFMSPLIPPPPPPPPPPPVSTKLYVYPLMTKAFINETFDVNVTIADVAELYGFEFKLGYNTTLLDIVDVTVQSFLNEPIFIAKNETEEDLGRYWLAIASLAPAESRSGCGALVTITFKVTGVGGCVLDLYDTKLCNKEAQPINHEVVDGYFADPFPGDANCDGLVDIFDLVYVAGSLGFSIGDPRCKPYADMNCDGTIDIFDLVIVGAHLGESYL